MDPISSVLLVIGLGIVGALALTWLVRPALARMGIGYAFHRRKQAALITAGLMVATTVIAAAGIAADSSGRSFTESLLGRLELTDVILDASWWTTTMTEDEVARFAEDPRLPRPTAVATVLRQELPFEAVESGLGDVAVPVWGVDPETFGAVGRLAAVEGNVPVTLPSWPDRTAVVNEAAARAFGIVAGDSARVYVAGEEVVRPVDEVFDGHLVVATWSEEAESAAPFTGGGVHHPDDVYTFVYDTTREVSSIGLRFTLTSAEPSTDFVLSVQGAETVHRAGPGPAPLEIAVPPEEAGFGRWNIRVDSPMAQDVAFQVTVTEARRTILDPKELALDITAVIEQSGSDPLHNAPGVFVSRDALQAFMEQPGLVNVALLDYDEGADLEALDATMEQVGRDIWASGVEVRNDRAQLERERAQIEDAVRFTFLGIGSFSILAGFMLIGVMMALLVEERKRILATSRAIGAQRSGLTVAHAHEGSVYSVAAGIAGLLGAIVVAAGLAGPLQQIFAAEGGRFVLILKPATALLAVGAGFTLTMLAIILSAHSASRFHIAAALKGEEHETKGAKRWGAAVAAVLGGLGALWTLSGAGDAWAAVLGPVLLGIGAAGVAARLFRRTAVYALASLALAAFLIGSFWWVDVSEENSQFLLYPLRGVLLSIAFAVLAAYSTWLHAGIVEVANRAGRAGVYLEGALGHLRRRPGRAALTISMFATVLVVLTALGTLFATFEPNDLGDTGGFDVIADSPLAMADPAAFLRENPPASGADPFSQTSRWVATPWVGYGVDGLDKVDAMGEGSTRFTSPYASAAGEHAESAVAVTPGFVAATSFQAAGLRPGFRDLDAAFAAVQQDMRLIVLSDQLAVYDFDRDVDVPIRVGDTFSVGRPGEDGVVVTVVGQVKDSRAAGAFVHPDLLDLLAQRRGMEEPGTRIWADPASGVSDARLAASFESAFRRAGMVAVTADHVDAQDAAVGGAFQTMISLFMGLGIVIGMVSLALIMGRNVLIRRAEIGTLRAIGASPQGILGMFSVEALYISLTSIGIGLGVGLLLAWATVRSDAIFVPLRIDWGALVILYGVTLLAALAAAFVPAWQASRVPPAQAVRYAE